MKRCLCPLLRGPGRIPLGRGLQAGEPVAWNWKESESER